jgi:hypothetical protein
MTVCPFYLVWLLNDVEVREQYQVKISNWFAILEINNDNVGIDVARETIRHTVSILPKYSRSVY